MSESLLLNNVPNTFLFGPERVFFYKVLKINNFLNNKSRWMELKALISDN